MSIGLKIAMTGSIAALVFGVLIGLVGKQMPRMVVAIPLLGGFFGGTAAVVVGWLMMVWA